MGLFDIIDILKLEAKELTDEQKKRIAQTDGILSKSLKDIGLSGDTLEIIESSTCCKVVGDLWRLSAKELCVIIGLNLCQVKELLDKMSDIASELEPKKERFYKHLLKECESIVKQLQQN